MCSPRMRNTFTHKSRRAEDVILPTKQNLLTFNRIVTSEGRLGHEGYNWTNRVDMFIYTNFLVSKT